MQAIPHFFKVPRYFVYLPNSMKISKLTIFVEKNNPKNAFKGGLNYLIC